MPDTTRRAGSAIPLLYLRREPTADRVIDNPVGKFDVVAYRDHNCQAEAGRWPWYFSQKPYPSQTFLTVDCCRHRAVWLNRKKADPDEPR